MLMYRHCNILSYVVSHLVFSLLHKDVIFSVLTLVYSRLSGLSLLVRGVVFCPVPGCAPSSVLLAPDVCHLPQLSWKVLLGPILSTVLAFPQWLLRCQPLLQTLLFYSNAFFTCALDGRRQESTWELNCESVTVCVSCPSC